MKRAAEFAKKMALPEVELKYRRTGDAEGYVFRLWRGRGEVVAASSLGAAYGACRSRETLISQAVEALGEQKPLFDKRILFIEGDSLVEGVITLPKALLAEPERHTRTLCEGAIALGFNTIAFGALLSPGVREEAAPLPAIELIAAIVEEYGLKLYAMVMAAASIPALIRLWPGCSGAIVTSRVSKQSQATMTYVELIAEGAACLRKAMDKRLDLLLYLPESSLTGWEELLDTLPQGVTLLFPAKAGCSLSGSLHPLWESLRRSPDSAATPLLPIINVGGLGVGGGLWPLLLYPYIDEVMSRMRRHPFSGIVAMVPTMPTIKGLSHCNLWVLGQRLWSQGYSANELAAQWFDIYLPDYSFEKCEPTLLEATALALRIDELMGAATSQYSSEQWRSLVEEAFARLKALNLARPWEGLAPYRPPFYADLRRLLFYLMLNHQLSVPQVIDDADLVPAFWTDITAIPGQGVRSGASVNLRKNIDPKNLPEALLSLYHANYAF